MKLVTNLELHNIKKIAREIGVQIYDDRDQGIATKGKDAGKRRMTFKLRPIDDTYRKIVERPFAGGRRRAWAVCWHGHYAFMERLFERDPNARIETGRYGKFIYESGNFAERAEGSRYAQVGSQMFPAYLGDQCDCEN